MASILRRISLYQIQPFCRALPNKQSQKFGSLTKFSNNYCKLQRNQRSVLQLNRNSDGRNGGLFGSCRQFHTSSRRQFVPPVFWGFIKPVAKIATMIGGRFLRKHYQQLSPEKQRKFRKKYSSCLGLGIIGLCIAAVANYNYHLKETPLTRRKRYIAFNNSQIMKLVIEEANELIKELQPHIMDSNNPYYEKVAKVVGKIMLANQDLEFFREQNWTLVVVNSQDANAFVLPTGHIFVYKGLFDIAKTEDQLAVVLGHEMSHALLQHGCEKLAIAQLLDYLIIVTMAAIWAIMPNDGIAFVTQWFYHKVVDLLISLPYSRKLEAEADEVGLELIAKACYDVRETSNFWLIMHIKAKLDELHNEAVEIPEWFSTHPDHANRAKTLDNMIPDAIKVRQICECPALPESDPRRGGNMLLEMYRKAVEEKKQQEIEDYAEKRAQVANTNSNNNSNNSDYNSNNSDNKSRNVDLNPGQIVGVQSS